VADSTKHIAIPKRNDEKTTMSAVDAELYLEYKEPYTDIGSVKNMIDPTRCEKILTGFSCQLEWLVRHGAATHQFPCEYRRCFRSISCRIALRLCKSSSLILEQLTAIVLVSVARQNKFVISCPNQSQHAR
jgi:hypothetical protein